MLLYFKYLLFYFILISLISFYFIHIAQNTFEAFLEHYRANWTYHLSSLDSYFLLILFFLLPWKIFQLVDKSLIQNTLASAFN